MARYNTTSRVGKSRNDSQPVPLKFRGSHQNNYTLNGKSLQCGDLLYSVISLKCG
jgi:hypothetical protein